MSWTEEKEKTLYKIQSQAFILKVIVYDSALYYQSKNRWSGWPPTILAGLATIIKTAEFTELTKVGQTGINIATITLTLLISIWSTIHMLLDYSAKKEKCREISDKLHRLSEEVRLIRSYSENERPPANEYIKEKQTELQKYRESMFLMPRSVFSKYYPNDPKKLQDLLDIQDRNQPIDLESSESI
jgi:hypothetical protein